MKYVTIIPRIINRIAIFERIDINDTSLSAIVKKVKLILARIRLVVLISAQFIILHSIYIVNKGDFYPKNKNYSQYFPSLIIRYKYY